MKRERKGMNDLQNAAANTVSVVILIPVVVIALILGALFIGLLIQHWHGVLIAFGLFFGLAAVGGIGEIVKIKRERALMTPEERAHENAVLKASFEREKERKRVARERATTTTRITEEENERRFREEHARNMARLRELEAEKKKKREERESENLVRALARLRELEAEKEGR
jgi:hypothetical protein